jgi:hypothetical protein
LREAGAEDQVAALAARAADHAPLDDAFGVARLLNILRWSGAEEQAASLLARDPAAHVSLDNPNDVTELIDALRKAGAENQASELVDRLAAERQFDLFDKQAGIHTPYKFGREPDGSPAPAWSWNDLD